jgi:hypothetical protein
MKAIILGAAVATTRPGRSHARRRRVFGGLCRGVGAALEGAREVAATSLAVHCPNDRGRRKVKPSSGWPDDRQRHGLRAIILLTAPRSRRW